MTTQALDPPALNPFSWKYLLNHDHKRNITDYKLEIYWGINIWVIPGSNSLVISFIRKLYNVAKYTIRHVDIFDKGYPLLQCNRGTYGFTKWGKVEVLET